MSNGWMMPLTNIQSKTKEKKRKPKGKHEWRLKDRRTTMRAAPTAHKLWHTAETSASMKRKHTCGGNEAATSQERHSWCNVGDGHRERKSRKSRKPPGRQRNEKLSVPTDWESFMSTPESLCFYSFLVHTATTTLCDSSNRQHTLSQACHGTC